MTLFGDYFEKIVFLNIKSCFCWVFHDYGKNHVFGLNSLKINISNKRTLFVITMKKSFFFAHISDKYQHLQDNIFFEITLKKSLFHLYFRNYPYSRKRTFFRSLFYVHYQKISTFQRKVRFLDITFKKLFFFDKIKGMH